MKSYKTRCFPVILIGLALASSARAAAKPKPHTYVLTPASGGK